MKTSLAASAILTLYSGAALAQSALTVYGVLDVGVSVDRGGVQGNATRLTSGMATQSRWGVRGSEDLGEGLSAVFGIEGGFSADKGTSTQGNTLFGRIAIVGLRGGFGSLTLGLQDTPHFSTLNAVVDPLRNGIARSNNLMTPTGVRARNSILYRSKPVNGFFGDFMYAAGEVAGDNAAGRALGGSLAYSAGPLNVRLAYHQRNNDTAVLKNTGNARNTLLGANYDFGPAKGYFGYAVDKGPNSSPLNNPAASFGGAAPVASTDSTSLLLGVALPLGTSTLIATYVRKDDKTAFNQDASQIALAYLYALSKRSDIYSSYARIRNKNGAAYTAGNSEEAGTGDKQFTFGLRHRF
ncbi:porin [Janthinobacterium fluminis]|uniref:Porin n=1 Tax=Janthinobacterium fluminis TaxID=2987524 RepID=A0ABT5K131_9BURK|nr:porin [Janthinobacterium fluminis]MDC8758385.1 porin [Janthinobacterium fluminis]